MPMLIDRSLKIKPPRRKPKTAISAATRSRTPKNKGANAARPPEQDAFTRLCAAALHADCVKEHRFHPTRKWRFDYAFPAYKVAVEIDGGVWQYGRHNRPQGYLADLEKFNAAAALGWRVLKFTPQQQYTKAAIDLIKETLRR